MVPDLSSSRGSLQFTFTLREGHKWSDGQPFTADDILFWYEDTQLDKDLAPNGPPSWLKSAGKPATVTKVDQVTVKFTFPEPSGLFLAHLAAGGGNTMTPKHYLQQFHQKYNPQGIDQLVKDNNVDGWVTLFRTKGGAIPGTPYNAQWYNTDLPTLHGWRVTTPFGAANRFVAERNPFYFKVDPEGNQLPYLDRVNFDIIQEVNVMVLKAANGEIDMQDRHIGTLPNKAVFTDNMQKGQYRLFEIVPSEMNTMLIFLNLTTKNPVLREVFRNKDFRIGLSHAIDRREIIDVVYVGQGEPWQAAPRRETPFFNERLAKQYTEHDPRKAAEHLDKAFAKKDGEGFRLGPDGKRIAFQIEVTTALDPTLVDALNLVKEHWRRVGVDMIVKVEDRALVNTRTGANEHDAYVWKGDAGLKDALINPNRYVPVGGDNFAPAWGTWFLNPTGAGARTQPEEPPAEVKRQQDLYRQLTVTGDEGRQVELMKQILEIAADQFYTIGINLMPNTYGIVRNNFRNVPATMFGSGGPFINPGPTNPSQYFIDG